MRNKSFVNRLVILTAILSASANAFAARVINERDRVSMASAEPMLGTDAIDMGPADASLPLDHMMLVLQRPAAAQATLETLLADQQNPASPNYHRWLTPEEFGARFSPSPDDVAAATSWLAGHGFSIDEIAAGNGWISFSGTAGSVEEAFQTEIHTFEANGTIRHANVGTPSVPRALAAVTAGVLSLHDIPKKGSASFRVDHSGSPLPQFTNFDGSHYLAPSDFATIYNSAPLVSAGTNGSGQTIAIVGRTDINPSDVAYFRNFFGLPASAPTIVHNGTAPGDLGGDEELEGLLDVEWAGAVAPGANVEFIVSKSTSSTDGVDLSAAYAVDHNVAPILSVSFVDCEKALGTSGNTFYKNLWSQAAAQGMTVIVCAGDSGVAGCNDKTASSGTSAAVNGLASTAYNVAVGGTEFSDSNASAYWSPSTAAVTQESALGYIPEGVWNESSAVSGGQGLWASGGGLSTTYSRPTWQTVPGLQSTGGRAIPDVSFSASSHDGYLMIQDNSSTNSGFVVAYGTSAAAPSMAGAVALLVQANGERLGNINPNLYRLATNQYGFHGSPILHDVVTGSNSVPGTAGFTAAPGFDLASGLGSLDIAALVAGWNLQTSIVAFASPTVSGNRASGSISITIARSGYLAVASSVQYATKSGTGTSGRDYVGASGTVDFAAGETTKSVSIKILSVPSAPAREFNVALQAPSSGTSIGSTSTATVILPAISNSSAPITALPTGSNAGGSTAASLGTH